MHRILTLQQHLAASSLATCESVESKLVAAPSSVLGRTTTALEPLLLDDQRRVLECKSLSEREAWLRYFVSVRPALDEGDYETEVSEGSLPHYVSGGSFFRSGPGLFERNGIRIHMADGDGLMLRIDFGKDNHGGKVRVKERYLQTPEFRRECEENRVLFRGSYGTSQVQEQGLLQRFRRNVGNLKWKVTGNTNHLYWGGRLFALHEVGLPIELDPYTLDVIDARCTLNGLLDPEEAFSAHHRVDKKRGTLLNYGLNYKNLSGPTLKFWEFDAQFKLISRCTLNLAAYDLRTIAHAFGATERYFIQVLAPCKGGFKYFLGWGVDDSIHHDYDAPCAYVCVVDRFAIDENQATWYKCVNWWPNHHVGAFEDENGDIVIDSVMYERKTTGWIERTPFDLPPTRVVRLRIPHARNKGKFFNPRTTEAWATHEILYNRCCEMPVTNPRTDLGSHRFVWLVDMTASKMPNNHADLNGLSHKFGEALSDMPWAGVIKLDLLKNTVQTFRPGKFCGEVVFVPDPASGAAEDDGALLSLGFDPITLKSEIMVMDAKDLTKGCIARIPLRGHVPFSFHCGWEPDYPAATGK